VLFHASLSGALGVAVFTRFTLVAWPAALLIFWLAAGPKLPRMLAPASCALLAAVGLWFTASYGSRVVAFQLEHQPFARQAAARLDADEPVWFDFGKSRLRGPRR
jgi:hypothetical protein